MDFFFDIGIRVGIPVLMLNFCHENNKYDTFVYHILFYGFFFDIGIRVGISVLVLDFCHENN